MRMRRPAPRLRRDGQTGQPVHAPSTRPKGAHPPVTKYLEIFFRYKLRFFLILLAGVALSALVIVMYPTRQAGGSLWVDNPNYFAVNTETTSGWNQYLTPAQNTLDQMTQMVQTEAYLNDLGSRLDAAHVWQDGSERATTLYSISTTLQIKNTGSHLVYMGMTCRRAEVCVAVIQGTIDIYKKTLAAQQAAQAKAASDFYTNQLNQTEAQLTDDQKALSAYIASHPNLTPGDQALVPAFDQAVRRVNQDKSTLSDLQTKLSGVQFASAATTDVNNAELRVIDPPIAFPSGTLSSLPKKQLLLVWAGCLGAGAGWLFLVAWLDRTARDPRDLEKILQVPVVAEIPMMGAGDRL
jgi:uncharacterized protein involved in exopolysaccharide biosynthesis